MSEHDTDHAALPCPLYAGGDCGPTPTTVVEQRPPLAHTGGDTTIPLTDMGVGLLAVGIVTAALVRFFGRSRRA